MGSAYAYLSEGADAIYLFNYFDGYNGCFESEYFFCNDDEQRQRFLTVGGDLAKMKHEPRRHVCTFDDVDATGLAGHVFLPMTITADRNGKTPLESPACYQRLRVATGEIGKDKTVTVTVAFDGVDGFDMADLEIYLNQRPCTLLRREKDDPATRPTGFDTFTFSVENDGRLSDMAVVEVGLTHGTAKLVWAEVGVN